MAIWPKVMRQSKPDQFHLTFSRFQPTNEPTVLQTVDVKLSCDNHENELLNKRKDTFKMNRKTSTLLSLGVSAVLIAAAIGLLYRHNAGMWIGNGGWGLGYHHMMGGGMGIVMIIFWIVLIGAFILLISGAINGIRASQKNDDEVQNPLEILKQRYARGEIDRAEYEDKRRTLTV